MEATFFAAAYVLHGPESFAYALIALIFAAWRKWVREWPVHLLFLLSFALVWPLLVQAVAMLHREPVHPDVAFVGKWSSVGAAVLWAYLAKHLWEAVAKRDQRKSPWWAHLSVFAGVFGLLVALSAYLPDLARSPDTIVLTEEDMARIRAGGPLVEEEDSSSTKTLTSVETLNAMSILELTRLAESGEPEAQSLLSWRLYEGQGTPADPPKAFFWAMKAAEQGNAVHQWNVSVMLENGMGTPADLSAAAQWRDKAAKQGSVDAQVSLADMYAQGRGVPRDEALAAEWYRKASDAGNAKATRELGFALWSGRGVPEDSKRAITLFEAAANQGDAHAQAQLGLVYRFGVDGVLAKNPQLASQWLLKAAEQGIPGAQNFLGHMYLAGEGVPRNHQQAYFWYLLASASGDSAAVTNRDNLEPRLTPQERADAQRDASAWKPTEPTR